MREPNPKFDLSRSAERTSGESTLEEVLDELALAQAMLAHSTSGFTLLDADGTLLYEHPNNEAITGYPVSESTGKNLFDFCHPSDAERLLPRLERLARSPGAVDADTVRWKHKSGHWVYLYGQVANRLDHPRLQGLVNTFYDVTDKVELEARLKAAEQDANAQWAVQVKQIVEANLTDPQFGVDRLAATLCLSQRQLQRRFREIFGQRPVAFLRNRRLDHARQLLESDNPISVAEAARTVALSSSYFTRIFKARFGKLPNAVRRRDGLSQEHHLVHPEIGLERPIPT
jgi:PAS domain S-box-containing protein